MKVCKGQFYYTVFVLLVYPLNQQLWHKSSLKQEQILCYFVISFFCSLLPVTHLTCVFAHFRCFLLTKTSHLMLFVLPPSRTASSSSSPTTKIRWSRLVRRRQTDASSRETTLFTESPPRLQRRRMNGSTASSESHSNSLYDDDGDDDFQKVLKSASSTCRAAISKDPFYEMLAARKKKVSSLKRL